MARFCGAIDERTQDFEGSAMAYTVDALSISIGSLFGSSPVTAFVESGAGISEGGKTGLTAMTTGVCFFVAIFFSPIFASIPPWATGCTLILVGSMMVRVAADINWRYMGDAIPAFVCLAVMPFSCSIADFWREDEDELGEARDGAGDGAGAGAGSESQVELDGVVKGGLRVKPLSASEEFDKLS
ncbi:nucleoside transporter [Trichophyton equinum CBS 127.97]|uniref:Nucleoside transporter n=1 Tax=Trichophyton equinum (strain ATCC MYA-4606 / CBS 127.97) TaxID=559882 RepID=F2PJC3_TRIEC|nr:nucleoside transporter [Trichophyton equinum CBS 127.97]